MDPDQWPRVKKVFTAALPLSPDARRSFLDERCGRDNASRWFVEDLLAEHDRAPGFLETPAALLARDWLSEAPTQLGAYRVLDLTGSGGMADVYLAERSDGAFRKLAAIKILKHGLCGADAWRRFEQERQVLANLDHPHVVKLLDGGLTNDGRPYFAMDYVEGMNITAYADNNHLRPAGRIAMFLKVCDAVAYLHAHGIIHRDLKPANILVNKEGEPKLLDFGIAKLLELDDTAPDVTRTGIRYLTPEYASPEQIGGTCAGPQSDVYSLGLLLYELLTGSRPGAGRRPLRLGGLPFALSRIIAKATRDEPAKRFANVDTFAARLRRFQTSPKWISGLSAAGRHNRVATGLLLLALLLPVGVGTALLSRLKHQPRTPAPQLHRLTAYPGIEDHPSLSPSGPRDSGGFAVVFGRSGAGLRGLWILDVFSSSPTQLTDENDCCAKWSPEGRSIAFARRLSEGVYDLSLISSQGGPVRTIARIGGHELSWAPDGKALAFTDRTSPGDPFSVYWTTLGGGERQRLTYPPAGSWGDLDCAVSPDGRSLAIVRYASRGNGDIFVVSTTNGEVRRLTDGEGWINGLTWTPDGREIIFASTRAKAANKAGLWRISAAAAATSEPTLIQLPRIQGLPARPTLASGRLVFEAGTFRTVGWKIPLGSSAPGIPVRIAGFWNGEDSPAYSPDGERLAVQANPKGDQQIWTMRPDGSDRVQVTHTRGLYTGWPSWSPEGSRIAYISNINGKPSLFVVNSSGGPSQPLPIGDYNAGAPHWSHDGRWIYFGCERSGSSQICRIAADGAAKPVQLTKNGGVEAFEAAAGGTLYFVRSHEFGPVAAVSKSGGPERELPGSPVVKAGFWTFASERIYFLGLGQNQTGDQVPVERFDPVTKKLEVLGRISELSGGSVLPGISVRPDGKEIAWSRFERGADLMLLENFR